MAVSAILTLDIITLIVSIAASILSWFTMTKIKGELKTVGFWFSLSISLMALRKVLDFIGEAYFGDASIWSLLEDIAFLFGIICFLYGSKTALKYFNRVKF